MNQCDFIYQHLRKNLIESKCIAKTAQQKIIDETLDAYKKCHYHSLDQLLSESAHDIGELLPLQTDITAHDFATIRGVCISTARRRLQRMINVNVDTTKKPFTYSIKKPHLYQV